MTRTTITTDQITGHVTISYDDHVFGERITRTFFCYEEGGYVREVRNARGNEQYPQVCERLASLGSTLYCRSRPQLANVIRREYRNMRREEKRIESRLFGS